MAREDFSISVTPNEIDVKLTPSSKGPNYKLVALLTAFGMMILFNCFFLFMPGKHNQPSMWHDLTTGSPNAPILFIAVFNLYMGWVMFRGERGSSPSDETFHCDRNEIIITRSPWFDLRNRHPHTYTYPLSDCSDIRFAKLFVSGRSVIDGIQFLAKGRRQWTLPGLEPNDAKQILIGLKNLGADVSEDSYLEDRAKHIAALRDGDTSWMDRSWMDQDAKPPESNK